MSAVGCRLETVVDGISETLHVLGGDISLTSERYITEAGSVKWTGQSGDVLQINRQILNRQRETVVSYQRTNEVIKERPFGFH